MLIREALAQGSADLKFAEIPSPALDSSILLTHILEIDRTALITKGDEKINKKACEAFCGLIERRALGECVAYITGKKEFRGLEFEVNKSVLVPRPDTETLVEAVLEKLTKEFHAEAQRNKGTEAIKVLDLCTGSGAVAISLKNEAPELEVHATDISHDALETAKRNAKLLLPGKKIHFYLGDLYNALRLSLPQTSGLPGCELFSLIISNPPYIPSAQIETLSAEVQNEPRIALDGGESGLEIINRIINDAQGYLINGGSLLLEADPGQMEEIKNLLANKGFKDIQLYKDLSGSQRVISGKYEN